MPTVIDSLVLELGLDAKALNQQQRDAVESLRRFEEETVRRGKNIEGQNQKVLDVFSGLKKQIVGLTALFLGGMGIKEFTGFVTQMDAAVGRNSRTLGMATREVSAWQGAFQDVGGTAQSATGSLQGLTGALNMMLLTGQGGALPVFNRLGISLYQANGQLKTAGALMLELARAMEGMDPGRAKAMLSLIPGMSEDGINLLLRGRHAVEELLQANRRYGGTTAESAKQAEEYVKQLALLDRVATSLGRTLFNMAAPYVIKGLEGVANLINKMRTGELGSERAPGTENKLTIWEQAIGGIGLMTGRWTREEYEKRVLNPEGGAKARLGAALNSRAQAGAEGTDHETYIRQSAAARGIDPDIAVKVARTEGLGGAYVGDRGSSFGDYQLHYGGVAGGGMAVSGLGDAFTKATGLDARDPTTWRAQIDFALDHAKTNGWGAWHGWQGMPFAGVNAGAGVAASQAGNYRGGDTNSTSTHIGSITVHAGEGSADSIAGGIGAAIKRQEFAAPYNYGQE